MSEPMTNERLIACRTLAANPHWCYDEGGQQFEYIDPEEYRQLLVEVERLWARRDDGNDMSRMVDQENRIHQLEETLRMVQKGKTIVCGTVAYVGCLCCGRTESKGCAAGCPVGKVLS